MKVSDVIEKIRYASNIKGMIKPDITGNGDDVTIPEETAESVLEIIDEYIDFIRNMKVKEE